MNIKLKSLLKIIAVSLVIVGTPVFSARMTYAAVDTTDWKTQSKCTGDDKTCVCPTTAKPGTKLDPNCGKDTSASGAAIIDCTGDNKPDAGCNLFTKYLNPFIKLLSILAGIAVVIGIAIGGIKYSASAGDPQKTSAAKKIIRDSLVALLVFFFLYALLKFLIPGGNLIT
jgi:hypothetical protein